MLIQSLISKNSASSVKKLVGSMIFAGLLTGCASTVPGANDPDAQLDALVKESDAEREKGQRDKAMLLLQQAAKEQPTHPLPWLKMANAWFEAGNYSASIAAANEVLQRDTGNQEAKSLLVVAGLRVAAGAVSGLRANNTVSANVRAKAESLTNSLRNVLGEKVLVPTPVAETKSPAQNKPVASARPRAKAGISTSATSNSSSSTVQTSSGANGLDPFKALK